MTVRFLGGVAERRRRFAFGPAPTFKQDFVTGGGGALPQGATFSRGTIGTLYNQSGLVAYAPSNLFTYSTNFTNAIWNPIRSSVPSTFYLAPDGNTTAQKLVEDTTASASHLLNATAATIGANQILSVYAKAGERTQIAIQVGSTASYFDLILGTVITGPTGVITSVGNGWYRCSVYGTNLASTNSFIILSVGGNVTYTGDGVSGAYVWGAQLEQGSNATTYTPTTTAAVYGPRFDYDPGNVLQQNLLFYSNTFASANWAKNNITVGITSALAPDGTNTATYVMNTVGLSSYIYQQVSSIFLPSTTYIRSFYAQLIVSGSGIIYSEIGGGIAVVSFNLSTGVAAPVGGSNVSQSMTPVGNGWYYCTHAFTSSATPSLSLSSVTLYLNSYGTSANAQSIGLWNQNVNVGSTALPYLATTSTAQTVCAPRGLLIEEQRTNLLLQSNDFQTSWTQTNITRTLNSTLSPEGVVNGVKIEATTTAAALLLQGAAVAATAATFSVYAKQGTGPTTANSFVIRNNTTATNLVTGTLNYSTGAWAYIVGTTGAIITNVGNGWWRVQLSASAGITSGDTIVGYVGFNGAAYTAGDFLYAYGAQLEAGTFPTSYIPTTSATVTRAPDSLTMSSISSWFNQTAGSVVWQGDSLTPSGTVAFPGLFEFDDGTSANRVGSYIAASSNQVSVRRDVASVTVGVLTSNTITTGTAFKYASNWTSASLNGSLNGGSISNVTNTALPTTNRLTLGLFDSYLNGHIRSFSYYNYTLTNAQLQQVTT